MKILSIILFMLTAGLAAPPHLAVIAKKKADVGVTPVSPGTTSMVAAFDMNDTTPGDGYVDSHSTYDMSGGAGFQTAVPPEYGIAQEGVGRYSNGDLDDALLIPVSDIGFAIRFQYYGASAINDDIFSSGGDFQAEWRSNGIYVEWYNIPITVPQVPVKGVWYVLVGSYNNATNTMTCWINGGKETSGTGTEATSKGSTVLGGDRYGAASDIYIDYAYFWRKQLTIENATFLYNSGNTLNYSDL
jgi:hypothetical protein